MLASAAASADEPWQKMLAGLAERRYFDTALEYLDWLQTSPDGPASFKPQYDFQVAQIHWQALQQAPFLSRDEHIRCCRVALYTFLKTEPDDVLVIESNLILGKIWFEEGRQRQDVIHSRGAFQDGVSYFERAEKLAIKQAKSLQAKRKADKGSVTGAELQAAYARFLNAKMLIQRTQFERAKTFPEYSEEFQTGLKSVAEDFEKMASTYRDYSVAFEAKLQAAKAYQELGDFAKTRELLGELNTLRGDEFLKIRTESLKMALEMSLAENNAKSLSDAIRRVRAWDENVTDESKISHTGQEILLLGAKNLLAQAERAKKDKKEHDQAIQDAAGFLKRIPQNFSSSIYAEARSLLQEMDGTPLDPENPTDFAQALRVAEDAIREFVECRNSYYKVAALEDNTIQQEKTRLKDNVLTMARKCEFSIQRALYFRANNTSRVEIFNLKRNLVNVYLAQEKVLEAAVLDAHLARHYSDFPDADAYAIHAAQCYRYVFAREYDEEWKSALADSFEKLRQFILQKNDVSDDVIEELNHVRLEMVVAIGALETAQTLLAQVAMTDERINDIEIPLGNAFWIRYKNEPDSPDRDAILAAARKHLESGMSARDRLFQKRGRHANTSETMDFSTVLAQIYLNAGEYQSAIEALHHPTLGPLSPAGLAAKPQSARVQITARLLMLRIYVATDKLDKAEEAMNQLESHFHGGSDVDENVITQIYLSLGKQLENRLRELNESGEKEQAKKVAAGFEIFLKRIRERGLRNTFQTLYWVADTFFRLGGGMNSKQKYYAEAALTFEDILKRITKEPNWAPRQAEESTKLRLAEAWRATGRFEAALNMLDEMLQHSSGRIDLQMEAARTLEAWGAMEMEKLSQAVTGRPINNGVSQNVWGWNGLIRRTSNNVENLADYYYESYLGKFRCVLKLAEAEKNAEKKAKLLTTIESDFRLLRQLRPELGGEKWREQFEQIDETVKRNRHTDSAGR